MGVWHVWGRGKVHTGCWLGTQWKKWAWMGGWIFKILNGGMEDWIGVAQGLDRWQAFVNAVVNFWVP